MSENEKSEARKIYEQAYEASHPKCTRCGHWHIPDCVQQSYENSEAYRSEMHDWHQRYPDNDGGSHDF